VPPDRGTYCARKHGGSPMAESALPDAVLAALPKDAPAGHRAFQKVKFSNNRCSLAFKRGARIVRVYTTVAECGSRQAAERVARALWMKFESGATGEEVLRFREKCYAKLQATGILNSKQEEASPQAASVSSAIGIKRELPDLDKESTLGMAFGAATSSSSSSSSAAPAVASSPPSGGLRASSVAAQKAPRLSRVGTSPQASSCGRSSGSSTLSPAKNPYFSFTAGLRFLRTVLEQKGCAPPKASWSELVKCIEEAEETEAQAGVSSASSCGPSPKVKSSPKVGSSPRTLPNEATAETLAAALVAATAAPVAKATASPRLASKAAGASEGGQAATRQSKTPSMPASASSFGVKRKLLTKRPPATPQQKVALKGAAAAAARG